MLQKAAESLGAPEELLCLVETDEDERIARDGGFFCIGYLLSLIHILKDPSVSGFFRFLAKVGDSGMKMQIVKIGFGDKL